LDRLLDPENESVTLHTMKKAASIVGLKLELQLQKIFYIRRCQPWPLSGEYGYCMNN